MGEGERIIAYAPFPSTGWSIGIVRPLSSILAPVQKTENLIRKEAESTATDISKNKQEMLNTYLIGSLILLIIISILAVLFARYITKPIGVLMDATRVIGSGDLSREVILHTGDEFEELGNHFNQMSQNLVQVMKSLEQTTAEKERYATELDIAREIQRSFLPETIPVITGLDVAAESIMAREVGGDFFDIFPLDFHCFQHRIGGHEKNVFADTDHQCLHNKDLLLYSLVHLHRDVLLRTRWAGIQNRRIGGYA